MKAVLFVPGLLMLICTASAGTSQAATTSPSAPLLTSDYGQMLMVGFRGTNAEEAKAILGAITEHNLGGVILFSRDLGRKSRRRNIVSSTQLKALIGSLQGAASTPLLVALDQEGGRVARLGAAFGLGALPSAAELGTRGLEETRSMSRRIAAVLRQHGVNLNLAPSVDVAPTSGASALQQENRLFSKNPEVVAEHARTFIVAHQSNGVLCAIKHFPGLGSAESDSHFGLPDISKAWSDRDLLPFRRLFAGTPADAGGQSDAARINVVMVGHVMQRRLDNTYPATLSRAIIGNLLRKQLKYDGVIISDALEMAAVSTRFSLRQRVRLAINAGVDILLFANNKAYTQDISKKIIGIMESLVVAGEVSPARIRRSLARIKRLKAKL